MNYKHGCTVIAKRDKNNPQWRAHYVWVSMRARCSNPKNRSYTDYGGRGITVDPAWADFQVFYADMGDPPDGGTLERADNDGPYSKANCRWATRAEQSRNKRNNRYLEYNGERRIVADWATHLGLPHRLLRVRLNRGWSAERTLATPPAIRGYHALP
jgi:hypothetical protein